MKKFAKILSVLLAFAMIITVVNPVSAKAAGSNGPAKGSDSFAYLMIITDSGKKALYGSDEFIKYQGKDILGEVKGATYDKSTNTLTIKDLTANLIEANMMGDDFAIKVEGTNTVGMVAAWGDHYGGSLTIEGTGTLNVVNTPDQKNGIIVAAEQSASKLTIKKGVTINITAKEKAVYVDSSTIKDSIVIESGVTSKGVDKVSSTTTEYKTIWVTFADGVDQVMVALKDGYWAYRYMMDESGKIHADIYKGEEGGNLDLVESDVKVDAEGYPVGYTPVALGTYYNMESGSKTASFAPGADTKTAKPAKPVVKVANKSGKAKITISSTKNADGYIVYYSTSQNGTYKKLKTIEKSGKQSFTAPASKLKKGKTYFIKVVAFAKDGGKTVQGDESAVKKVVLK